MPWDINVPAGGDAANTIDNGVIANNTALDTWASAITDGITAGAATVLRARRAANATIIQLRADAADTVDRFNVDLNGLQQWGSGAAAVDVALLRSAANVLQLASGDTFRIQQDPVVANDLSRKSYVDTTPTVIRGRIDTTGAGSILHGTGFTIVRNGVGDVTVTFTTAFAAVPVVIPSTQDAVGNVNVAKIEGTPTTTTARITRYNLAAAAVDGIVQFIAMTTV